MSYYVPKGGLKSQTQVSSDKSIFTTAYALVDKEALSDIVTSGLPHWKANRIWILARPMTGFAETFAHYIVDLGADGGSSRPEPDLEAQGVVFVIDGEATLTIGTQSHVLERGGYAYLAAGEKWSIHSKEGAVFHWIRKVYEAVDGVEKPESFVTKDQDIAPRPMEGSEGRWSTTRFVDPEDLRHDMHVNIVNFEPGGLIPFDETHVMEHMLYVLEGKADYRLNTDWHEVEAGDYMWLRAFCPQSCIAKGSGRFRYLLYKDVNRHPKLRLP